MLCGVSRAMHQVDKLDLVNPKPGQDIELAVEGRGRGDDFPHAADAAAEAPANAECRFVEYFGLMIVSRDPSIVDKPLRDGTGDSYRDRALWLVIIVTEVVPDDVALVLFWKEGGYAPLVVWA